MWISDRDGNLVNLTQVRTISYLAKKVLANHGGEVAAVLFSGTAEECIRFRDDLMDQLIRAGVFMVVNRGAE